MFLNCTQFRQKRISSFVFKSQKPFFQKRKIMESIAGRLVGQLGATLIKKFLEMNPNVGNVLNKLDEEFKPSKNPSWGPVFDRPSFQIPFIEYLDKSTMYHVYYGPSGSGKSVALSHALKGKTGVIYFSVRGSSGSSSIWQNVGTACGLDQNMLQKSENVEDIVIQAIREAARIRNAELHQRLIFLVEDIHDTKLGDKAYDTLCGQLLELYADGLANIIYNVSDYSALSHFQRQSGHSSRLSSSLFPDMTDKELKDQLLRKDFIVDRHETKTATAESGHTWKQVVKTQEKIKFNEKEIDLIVEKIGSHMEYLIKVLRDHSELKRPVDALVNQLVGEHARQIFDFFSSLTDLGQIFVAHQIFEKLLKSREEFVKSKQASNSNQQPVKSNEESVEWSKIYLENKEHLDLQFVRECIVGLVTKNFLTYVDAEHVKAHSRATLAGYEMAKTREALVSKFQEAEIDVKARDRKKKHSNVFWNVFNFQF